MESISKSVKGEINVKIGNQTKKEESCYEKLPAWLASASLQVL
jgi:hypothetical protein